MTYKKSWQRPLSVTQEHFDSEYDRIFNKPNLTDLEVPKSDPSKPITVTDKHRQKIAKEVIWVDELAGNGDTFEEKVSLSNEMQLHGDKHKPEGL